MTTPGLGANLAQYSMDSLPPDYMFLWAKLWFASESAWLSFTRTSNHHTSHGLAIATLGAFRSILKSRGSNHIYRVKPSAVGAPTADVELSTARWNRPSISMRDWAASSINRLVNLRN